MTNVEKAERLINDSVYLRNKYENIVLKTIPGKECKYYVKFPGEEPYELNYSTKLVTDTLLEWDEISKKDFESFK
jgi:protein tyrosine/serine phosphatase